MKFELIAPPGFIAKGIEAKNLPAFFQHLLRIRDNLRVKSSLACGWPPLCAATRAPVHDANSDQSKRSDHRQQSASNNSRVFEVLISFQRKLIARCCHTVLLV